MTASCTVARLAVTRPTSRHRNMAEAVAWVAAIASSSGVGIAYLTYRWNRKKDQLSAKDRSAKDSTTVNNTFSGTGPNIGNAENVYLGAQPAPPLPVPEPSAPAVDVDANLGEMIDQFREVRRRSAASSTVPFTTGSRWGTDPRVPFTGGPRWGTSSRSTGSRVVRPDEEPDTFYRRGRGRW
jgi:hypothetical protein